MTEETTKITLLDTPAPIIVPVPIGTTLAPEVTNINNNHVSTTTPTPTPITTTTATMTTTPAVTPHIIQEALILSEPFVLQADVSVSSYPIIPLGLDSQSLQFDVSIN